MTILEVHTLQKHWEYVNFKVQDKNIKIVRKGNVRKNSILFEKGIDLIDKQLLKAHL